MRLHAHMPLTAAVILSSLGVLGCAANPAGPEPARTAAEQAPSVTSTAQAQGQPSAPKPAALPAVPAPQVNAAPLAAEPEPNQPPTAAGPSNPAVAEALRYDPADPLADLEKADALDRGAGRMPETAAEPPARGCVLVSAPRRVWSSPGLAAVAALGADFVVAGYAPAADGGEKLFVVRAAVTGALEPLAAQAIIPAHPGKRAAPPGLATQDDHGVALAFVDGAGALFLQQLQVGGLRGAAANQKLASGVDARFAPAVTYGKRGALVAYTLGTTPMRTTLACTGPRGEVLESHDVTPAAMAAAAPAFVSGAVPPLLVTADPRDGMSPIARTQLDMDGRPSTPEVAVPVSMMSQPAQLTAAACPAGTFVAFTGLGAAATSAVGVVQVLPKPGTPEALVKGIAYGALHVSAVRAGQAVVFAADSPLTSGKTPAHDVTLTRIDAQGKGPALHVASPTGDATFVSIARAEGGRLGVVFTGKDGVYLARARCDEH